MNHQSTEITKREVQIAAYWLKAYLDQHPDRDRKPLTDAIDWLRTQWVKANNAGGL